MSVMKFDKFTHCRKWVFDQDKNQDFITQCGNLAVLLQPLRFYVKSVFVSLHSQNMPFWQFSTPLNFSNSEFLHFVRAKIYETSKLRAPKIVKAAVSETLNLPKADFL